MPAESAVKALRQTNGGQRVNTRCCSYACQQGRTCPVHQACELPDLDDEDRDGNSALLFVVVSLVALFWNLP